MTADAWSHTSSAQRIHFGAGSFTSLPAILREVGARRILLVTSERRLASDDGQRLVAMLGRSLSSTFDGVRPHVPTSAVQAALGMARDRDIDSVVTFGGGSAADLGKAVCFFSEQEAGTPGASYVDRPNLPHVAIATTYSGAELTASFGITDENTRRKSGGAGPTVAPIAAIYDPELMVGVPADISAQTGMNALAHGIECAYSPSRTPEAEAIALACIDRLATSLPAVVADIDDLDARSDAFAGAVLGGRALQNASMGVHHGLAQLLGGRTGLPHGLVNAVLLSHAVRFNLDGLPEAEVRAIGAALGDPDDPAGAIDRLRATLGLPGTLSECGVDEEDIEAVARMAEGNPSVRANRRPVEEDDALAILESAHS